jgi:hypothetical protein
VQHQLKAADHIKMLCDVIYQPDLTAQQEYAM